jgi:xanthine dehydrogenase YagR molybdenum-binding subunit
MTGLLDPRAVGQDLARLDGWAKVTGTAPYAFEQVVDRPAYLYPLQATVARGRVRSVDDSAAREIDGVLGVLTHENAPRLASDKDPELWLLQSDTVAFRGQVVGAVVAETQESARHAAGLVAVEYDQQPHQVELRADSPDLRTPDTVLPEQPAVTDEGDVEAGLAAALVVVDEVYTTPMEHNNPMEPHATTAVWQDGTAGGDGIRLTLYDSTQGASWTASVVAEVFGLDPAQVRVISPYVGGGFGSKAFVHAHVVLAAMAAQLSRGRPVKVALTRQQMFALVGYRTPTIQRIRLGAGTDGRLSTLVHEVVEQTSRIKQIAEQTAASSRIMYAAPNRRTAHRLADLDVGVPTIMRAPGECPGMFAAEVAMDELAVACGLDPIELRSRNEPDLDPETGLPFSSRNLLRCYAEGARRFGWDRRDPRPGVRLEGAWRVGTGMAASTYPAVWMPGSAATVRYGGGRYLIRIAAAEIGTGAWTTLTQIAADALSVPVDAVQVEIGDSALPPGSVAGQSAGTASWGSAILVAARAFRQQHGSDPAEGAETLAGPGSASDNPARPGYALHSFGAQFAEVRVHADTGEIRATRMLGVFDAGRIINPRTARSQFVGGMTMGLSMALHEHSVVDPRFGHVVTHDFADYHIAANADVRQIEAYWLDEPDPHANALGARGIGEIGVVGAAAAIANAAWHATGIRVRQVPITADMFLR